MKDTTNINSTELWKTTYKWLKVCNCPVNSDFCKEEITTHTDYPALTSVTDFLEIGGMEYRAVESDASYINSFNYPLLAHLRKNGQEFFQIIYRIDDWNKQEEISRFWTGIVLFPGINASWKNSENSKRTNLHLKNKAIAITLLVAGLLFYFVSTFLNFNNSYNPLLNILSASFGLFSLIDFIISLFALGIELGFQNEIVKQVCGVVNKGGCEQVLKSRYAKGFAGISPSDASVVYFAIQFLFYIASPFFPGIMQAVYIFAFIGFAIVIWSFYTQAFLLKQWCAVCLSIASVLVIQTAFAYAMIDNFINLFMIGSFSILFILFSLILIPIKQLLKINSTNKLKLAELKKWKSDVGVFLSQWRQQQEVDVSIWKNDMVLGNEEAPMQITIACNPYCWPCAKAHEQLDHLLQQYKGKIMVQVRLLCNAENGNDKRTIATNAILQKTAEIDNKDMLQEMLTEWFASMNFEKWFSKWKPDRSIDVSERIQQHQAWMEKHKIAFTPTFFINGRKLPGRYSLTDLEILIPQLSIIIQSKNKLVA